MYVLPCVYFEKLTETHFMVVLICKNDNQFISLLIMDQKR